MHWRRKWQPTPVFMPGEFQGQRSLLGAINGVTQSRTRLIRLSSSSSSSSSTLLSLIFIKAKGLHSDVLNHLSSPTVLVLPLILMLIPKTHALHLKRVSISTFPHNHPVKNPEPNFLSYFGHLFLIMSRLIPTVDSSASDRMPLISKKLNS